MVKIIRLVNIMTDKHHQLNKSYLPLKTEEYFLCFSFSQNSVYQIQFTILKFNIGQ